MSKKYKAVALYSGGTDSTLAPIIAREEIGDDMLLLMIDLGCTPESIKQAEDRAKVLNLDFKVINGVEEFACRFLSEAIKMNGSYFGYPLGTPLGRAFMMELALRFLDDNPSIDKFIIHGCNARQNTRFRIEKLCNNSIGIKAMGPFTQRDYTRLEKVELLKKHGIVASKSDGYAQDENIFCRALEGDIFNNLNVISEDTFLLTTHPSNAPNEPVVLSILFENGLPIEINGNKMSLCDIITECKNIGGKHAIGRIVSLEDTIPVLGYKERGVYESPASVILYTVHRYIEDIVLNKIERSIKRRLEEKWADVVYGGNWFDSERTQISEFCNIFHSKVSGKVSISLYKGSITILDAQISNSILLKTDESAGAY